ncbi:MULTISPECIES: NAD(P)/FAD-dependent oxidoreductase [Cupriavidus]|uniref:FAD-dependent pyridine nucleotide-disulfide oxidoreductase n=1 Tax=Cupriavidus pinatubonensis (strain JMP 134 / LMG 1197) TaxID=264198 RepID=Q46S14_CUPPJ|nr:MULTISPECIES: FAD-dependent oxidoreductase [Cupriavidus]TPQ28808.1 pyridine nucleotide-disulfide oxidoreductase [Cupriavidus pinatubonensis]
MHDEQPRGATANVPTSTIVIVGAGQAGGWAAQTLRNEGFTGRLVLIGDESHPPYERPPLSKAVLAGEAEPSSTQLLRPDAFEALGLEWWPDIPVNHIDRHAKRLEMTDGKTLAYDKLILCTGGRARTLTVPGADRARVHTLRTIGDALSLAQEFRPGRSVAVIGGGWIGLEVAATARQRGAEVTVIEAQGRLCERSVPPEISEHLLGLHATHGVHIRLGVHISGIARGADGRPALTLADGDTLTCDAIVAGVGLVPNDDLARDAGLDCDGGIIVDERCCTSDPDIFAAGDVAVTPNPWAGRRMRLESWQNAQEQGIAAARAALCLPVVYQPLPWFWSDQYDMNLQIYGVPLPSHRIVTRGMPGDNSFALFYLEDDVIKAALGANAARDLRFARRLIEQSKPVDVKRLADADVPMGKLSA